MAGTQEGAAAPVVENFDQLWADAKAAAAAEGGAAQPEPEPEPEPAAAEANEAGEQTSESGEAEAEPVAPEPEEPEEPVLRPTHASVDARAYIKRERKRMEEKFEAATTELVEKAKRGLELDRLARLNDFDGIAKLLGKKSWNDLTVDYLETEADPSKKSVAAVQEELRLMREEAAKEREAAKQERELLSKAQLAKKYRSEVSADLGKMTTLPAGLANDEEFIEGVILIQQHFWDQEKQTTISKEQAAQIALDNLRKQHATLSRYFPSGQSAASTQPQGQSGSPGQAESQQRRAPTAIPQRQVADAEPERGETIDDFESDKDWFANWEKKLRLGRTAR